MGTSMETDGRAPGVDEFVAARWSPLCRFGYLLVGSREGARDLTQEALVKCLPRWSSLDAAGVEQYVRKVMARIAWNDARRRHETSVPTLPDQEGVHALDEWARAVDVARALARLPRDQRIVIILRYWLDYDEATIADTLGCRRGTVKSRASRAYSQLRTDLNLVDYATPDPHSANAQETSSELI